MTTPRLVYDDDCGFCAWCVRWALRYGEFEPVGFTALSAEQIARLPDDYETCMHLITDEAVYSCGEGLEQVVARWDRPWPWLVTLFRRLPGWSRIRDRGYRFVADRRAVWGRYRACDIVK